MIGAVLIFGWPSNTLAQSEPNRCQDRNFFTEGVLKRWKEVPVVVGIISDTVIMEVFSSKEGKSWTVLITDSSGKSCFMIAGKFLIVLPINKGSGISYSK